MWRYKSEIEFQNCGLLSSGRQFPPSWRWAQVLCTGSVGSTPSPSASAVPRPVTDCTLDTYAPDGSVYKRDGQAMCFKGKERTTILTQTERRLFYISRLHTERKIFDLVAPEGQSTGTDVQNYVWSQTCQHHGFVVFRGWQLSPYNVQFPRQRRGAGRANGGWAAELAGPVLITENMWASCDPGKAVQLGPALWEVA